MLDRFPDAVLVHAGGDVVGRRLDGRSRVAHGHPDAGGAQHLDVVAPVPKGDGFRRGQPKAGQHPGHALGLAAVGGDDVRKDFVPAHRAEPRHRRRKGGVQGRRHIGVQLVGDMGQGPGRVLDGVMGQAHPGRAAAGVHRLAVAVVVDIVLLAEGADHVGVFLQPAQQGRHRAGRQRPVVERDALRVGAALAVGQDIAVEAEV